MFYFPVRMILTQITRAPKIYETMTAFSKLNLNVKELKTKDSLNNSPLPNP